MDKRILLSLIILINLFFIVNISTYARLVGGPGTFPQSSSYINYDSEPYEVDEYDIQDVIEKARGLDYTIKFSTSCTDISANECEARGLLKETIEEHSPDKSLSVGTQFLINEDTRKYYNKDSITSIAINVYTANYDFSAGPKGSDDPYIWRSGVGIPKDKDVSLGVVSKTIVEELKNLGILSKDITIEFGEGYIPPTLASGRSREIKNYFQNKISFFAVLVIIILVSLIILLIKRKSK